MVELCISASHKRVIAEEQMKFLARKPFLAWSLLADDNAFSSISLQSDHLLHDDGTNSDMRNFFLNIPGNLSCLIAGMAYPVQVDQRGAIIYLFTRRWDIIEIAVKNYKQPDLKKFSRFCRSDRDKFSFFEMTILKKTLVWRRLEFKRIGEILRHS